MPATSPGFRPLVETLRRLAAGSRPPVAILTLLVLAGTTGRAADTSLNLDDAFIREGAGGHQWTLGTSGIDVSIVATKAGVLVERLDRPGRANVLAPRIGDARLTYDGTSSVVGDRTYRYVGASSQTSDGRVVLTVTYALRDRPITVHRHYAVAPGVPAIELWTSVESDGAVTVNDPSPFTLEFTLREAWWQRGLEVPDEQGGPFERGGARLADGQTVEFGSDVLSSRHYLPWFGLAGDGERVIAGVVWSGSWRASLQGTPGGATMEVALPDTAVVASAGRPVETPHAFLAVTGDSPAEQARGLGAWIASRRGGRPFADLATYNTWFTFGTYIDDPLIRRQMEGFAALGGELFELDAGWYPPIAATDRYDFTAGLGSWQVDRTRFPNGLGPLSDYAHGLGLKFGVWVEPERVGTATINRAGPPDRVLARQNGQYQPGADDGHAEWAQICLATDEGWNWVRDRLVAFLAEARADYVKIDLNGWAVCTREDHEHGPNGGNFAHTQGVYRLIRALRERFPALLIENVSGGARRLDPALLALTDASWMDDRSHPSPRVRHHHELLSSVVPPSALLSYVMAGEDEPLIGAKDPALLSRSRTLGALGLSADLRDLTDLDETALATYIDQFKFLRGLRREAFAAPLTAPVSITGGGPGWDVVEHVNPANGVAAVYAFRNGGGDRRVHVTLVQLRPEATYRIRSLDGGSLGTQSGAALMTNGFDIDSSPRSAAQVLLFEPQ